MRHFRYKSLAELEQSAREVGAHAVRFEHDRERVKAILARPVPVADFVVGNSMAIHPMEGCDGMIDGRPGELTWRRYDRFARGGAKLVWFEATAVREDGRANPRQLWLSEATVDDFARLLEHVRSAHAAEFGTADDLLLPIQLTHSGRYSHARRIIAYHNPLIDAKTNTPADYPLITDDELERLEDDYLAAGRLALRAGFQAFELKVVHGYLLSELMGATTRAGRYGGPLENRTRFIRNVLVKFRDEFGSRLLPCMRLNGFDGVPFVKSGPAGEGKPMDHPTPYPWGWGIDASDPLREDLSEVKQAIAWFRDWGIRLLNVSLGSPYYNPHIGRPFESPDEGNYEQPEHPLHGVDRHFRIAGDLQRSFPDLPMVGTGYSWLQKYAVNAGAANLEAGAIHFMGIGRGALAHPSFAREALETGTLDERRVCKTLTYCTYLMRQKTGPMGQAPTGCPPFDKDPYGQIIKEVRAAKRAAASQ